MVGSNTDGNTESYITCLCAKITNVTLVRFILLELCGVRGAAQRVAPSVIADSCLAGQSSSSSHSQRSKDSLKTAVEEQKTIVALFTLLWSFQMLI